MNDQTKQQLDRIAEWAAQFSQDALKLRWQLLADRVRKEQKAA